MKKIISYLLAFCAFAQVKSAKKDISYNLASYTQSITTTVQEEYRLDLPKDVIDLLLQFVPSNKYQKRNKYQTSKLSLNDCFKDGFLFKDLVVRQGNKYIELVYDEKKQIYYCWIDQSPTSLPIQLDYTIEYTAAKKGIENITVSTKKYQIDDHLTLPLSAWYEAELEEKNMQTPIQKITLYKSKVYTCKDTHGGQMINFCDYSDIDQETIYIHPECTNQEIIDSIVLHLRNQRKDKPHPHLIMRLCNNMVPADQSPAYFTFLPNDLTTSSFGFSRHFLDSHLKKLIKTKHFDTLIMESHEESLYDVLKKKESESELDCCENKEPELAPSPSKMRQYRNGWFSLLCSFCCVKGYVVCNKK